MTTPTPYAVTYDDVVALVRVMENAGRAQNASWFDVAHRVLQGLHNRNIVNYSIPRVDRDSIVQENARLETQIAGLLAQLQDCQRNLGARTSELATRTEQLDARTAALTTCQTELSTCRERRESR